MLEKLKTAFAGITRRADQAESQALIAAITLFSMLGMNSHASNAKGQYLGNRGQMGGAGRATDLVVGLVVAGLMAAFLLPIAIEEISNVSTTNWGDGASSLWEVLPIMIVLAIFLFFVGLAVRNRR